MNTVTFGTYDSYTDLNLILSKKKIGSPAVKMETLEIPGSDVVLDFTEFSGEPRYKHRTLEFEFSSMKPYSEQLAQDSSIKNALHGRKLHITLSDDSDYYFVGRISVGDWENDKGIGKVKITCDCEPWRYKQSQTVVTQSITTSGTVTLTNSRRSATPTIRATSAVTIAWTGGSASISANVDQIVPDLILTEGSNTLNVTGTASVTFTYQEGAL